MSDTVDAASGPSPAEIRERRFSVSRKGFDQAEVTSYLGGLAAEVERLRTGLASLRAELADAARTPALPVPLDEETVVATVGEEMAAILRSAHTAASDLRKRAQEEAERTVAGAQGKIDEDLAEAERRRSEAEEEAERRLGAATTEAARLLAEATTDSQRHLTEARGEAERLVTDATTQAETAAVRIREAASEEGAEVLARAKVDAEVVRRQAEQDRRSAVETTQALRERILNDLSRRRRTATVQIDQLLAGRERLLDAYGTVRSTLDEVTAQLERVDREAKAAADEVGRRYGVVTGADEAVEDSEGPLPTEGADGSDGEAPEGELSEDGALAPVAVAEVDEALAIQPGTLEVADGLDAGEDDPAVPDSGVPDPGVPDSGLPDPASAPDEPSVPDRTGGLFARLRSGLAADAPAAVGEDAAADAGPGEAPATGGGAGVDDGDGVDAGGEEATVDAEHEKLALSVHRTEVAAPTPAPEVPAERGEGGRARAGVRVIATPRAADARAAAGGEGATVDQADQTDEVEPAPTPPTRSARRSRVPGNRAAPATPSTRRPPSRPAAKPDASAKAPRPEASSSAAKAPKAAEPEPVADEEGEEQPDHGEGVALSDEDETRLQRRESAVADIETGLSRRLKRLLQDEHNDLLDQLRGANGRAVPIQALPETEVVVAAWVEAATPLLDTAAAAGTAFAGAELSLRNAKGVPGGEVATIATELARAIVEPTSRRLSALLAEPNEGGWEHLAETIGAVYRNARSQRVDAGVADAVATSFAVGTWFATPDDALLRWVAEDAAGPCPDCDDDALAGAQRKGEEFPTGQLRPPAHDGCRCLLVPERA